MQHLIATARNLSIAVHEKDGKTVTPECELHAEPLIEMVLTTYERQMEFVDGTMINIKKTQSHRIGLNINSAQALATQLEEWIKEAQALETKLEESDLTCDSKTE
jgi:hypothetical protein